MTTFATLTAPAPDPCHGCLRDCAGPMQGCLGREGLCLDTPSTARPLGVVIIGGDEADEDGLPF